MRSSYVSRRPSLILAFKSVVVEEFLDEIDVRHEHAPAAVPLQIERVQGVSLGVIRLEQVQVRVPLVSDHLSAEKEGSESSSSIGNPGFARDERTSGQTRRGRDRG